MEDVVSQLKMLLETDHRLLLPIIGALVDVPLPQHLAPQLAELAENAISVVDESDLPVLFRTLIKSLGLVNPEQTALRLRREMASLSHETLALVVEVLWEVLPTTERAAQVFVEQIVRENQDRQLAAQPSLADLAVVLVLFSDAGGAGPHALRAKATNLLEAWLSQGVFPFSQLQLIISSYRRANEAWERMVPAVWRLCLWLLESLSSPPGVDLSPSLGEDEASGPPGALAEEARCGLEALLRCLYKHIPAMQETVVSTLLSRCFAPTAGSTTASALLPSS
jgi:hypothetical protein